MKSFRNIRVIPVVLVAVAGLATLKVAGLVLNGGYVFDYQPNTLKKSWAQENLNFPTGRDDPDITGSTHGEPKEAPKPAAPETKLEGTPVKMDETQPQVSASERAILERLQAHDGVGEIGSAMQKILRPCRQHEAEGQHARRPTSRSNRIDASLAVPYSVTSLRAGRWTGS